MLSLHGSRTERIQPEEKEKCAPPRLLSHVRRKHKSASISTSTSPGSHIVFLVLMLILAS